VSTACKTCDLIASRDTGTVPLWDAIHRTALWDIVHSYNTSLPGWLVLVARRHINAIDELTANEATELGMLLQKTSAALKRTTGCAKTYVIQFAEHPEHPHVHFHVVPRHADMPPEYRSLNVFKYLGVSETERVSEDVMNKLAMQIRKLLLD
jgi:diadenosine tetraphosphate (Ap4A) HIT family hydrolase